MKQRRIVVVGTGTEIGKTHASVSLLLALRDRGVVATGLKPIESGVGAAKTDADRLAEASGTPPRSLHCYAFAEAISPHLAARRTSTPIELGVAAAWVDTHTAPALLIETAGGLLSPLGPGISNLNLVLAVRPTAVVLVAPDRLGVLHEVSSAMLAMATLAPRIPLPVVVLQPPAVPDSSTGTNREELLSLGLATTVTEFPRCADPTQCRETAARVLSELPG